jgi:hypothetical protein
MWDTPVVQPSVELGKCVHRDPNQKSHGLDERPTTSLGGSRDKAQIDTYVKENSESFAGVWIEGDGSFAVAFTADVDTHLRELRALLGAPERSPFSGSATPINTSWT